MRGRLSEGMASMLPYRRLSAGGPVAIAIGAVCVVVGIVSSYLHHATIGLPMTALGVRLAFEGMVEIEERDATAPGRCDRWGWPRGDHRVWPALTGRVQGDP